ncbi:hypothetical protein PspLS_07265 [Pyricularia sp. CBS 133598]|nr:hypothetical protein PspLS_07265 [Pyricularia sp. CBS 133598]
MAMEVILFAKPTASAVVPAHLPRKVFGTYQH